MRVCYVADYGVRITGGHRSLLNLMEQERKKGVEPYLVCERDWELLNVARQKGIEAKTIRVFPCLTSIETPGWCARIRKSVVLSVKRFLNGINYPQAVRYLQNNKIEIVHLNSLLSSHVWALAAKQCGIPYVWHIREFMTRDHKVTFSEPDTIRALLSRAASLIAISGAVRDFWRDWSGREPALVYNGLPPEEYWFEHAPLFSGPDTGMVIVGRVVAGKGQLEAVKALEILREKGWNNVFLKIVGYRGVSEYELAVKKYIGNSPVKEQIELIDFTYDLKGIREKCDIGITTSCSEAFGRVTVENMMAGLVTVGADTGGTPEIIRDGETGYLYRQGDPADLARVLEKILLHKGPASVVARVGQAHALSRFSVSRTAEEVYEIYQEALDHARMREYP